MYRIINLRNRFRKFRSGERVFVQLSVQTNVNNIATLLAKCVQKSIPYIVWSPGFLSTGAVDGQHSPGLYQGLRKSKMLVEWEVEILEK